MWGDEKNLFVEFSTIQNCFHIAKLDKIIAINLSMCKQNISNGFVIIGGPFTYEEAHEFTKKNEMLEHVG